MIKRGIDYLTRVLCYHRSTMAFSRAAAVSRLRNIDDTDPSSWEFRGFSQNGEDGIIDYLISKLNISNSYFVEIGSSDGLENNTAWLALGKLFSGIMVEGNERLSRRSKLFVTGNNLGVESLNMFVTQSSVDEIMSVSMHNDPDLMSVDIDGNDYHITKAFMEAGFRPKIFVVEYNATYGPDEPLTVSYKEDFYYYNEHSSGLYYGVSIQAWKNLFTEYGYKYLTVDSNGVNAFFIEPGCFDDKFLDGVRGKSYQDNYFLLRAMKMGWEERFDIISECNYVRV